MPLPQTPPPQTPPGATFVPFGDICLQVDAFTRAQKAALLAELREAGVPVFTIGGIPQVDRSSFDLFVARKRDRAMLDAADAVKGAE